jgi:hypothetical protein
MCGLTPTNPKDWSCSTGTCSEGCIVPANCAPAPKCSVCP